MSCVFQTYTKFLDLILSIHSMSIIICGFEWSVFLKIIFEV